MSEEDILDYKKPQLRPNKLLSAAFVFSMLLFFYWFIAGIAHLPYGDWALLVGLAILLAVTLIRFVRKPRRQLFEYFYLLGKVVLIAAIYFNLLNIVNGFYLIYAAFACFAAGLLLLFLKE